MEVAAAERLTESCPGLIVAGAYSPPFGFEKNKEEVSKINQMLLESNADILFVGVGSPKQDFFVEENMATYKIPITFPVGSMIDIVGGRVKLEWFYRFCQEPKRLFRRYFVESWKIIGYYWAFRRSESHILHRRSQR